MSWMEQVLQVVFRRPRSRADAQKSTAIPVDSRPRAIAVRLETAQMRGATDVSPGPVGGNRTVMISSSLRLAVVAVAAVAVFGGACGDAQEGHGGRGGSAPAAGFGPGQSAFRPSGPGLAR